MREIAWNKYDEQKMKEVMDFSEGYKKFISECKTERECVTESIKIAEAHGYRNLEDVIRNQETLKPGDKVYANNICLLYTSYNDDSSLFSSIGGMKYEILLGNFSNHRNNRSKSH